MSEPDAPCELAGLAGLAKLAPLSHAVFRVARLHKMMAGQLLRGMGLYPSQELVMMRLWTAGPQRHCDLVRMLESEAPTMTRTIQRLEKAGLVRTSRSSADRRSIVVEPTKESLAMREKVEAAWTELEARTAGEWDEVKQKQILAALSELETNLLGAEEPEEPGSECSSL